MILAIDLGNYNIKTSEGIIFSSKFSEGLSENPIGEEIIKYNNKYYTMTKGEFDNTFDKSKKDYIPNLLYAISNSSSKEDVEFDLILGVPLDNLGISSNLKEELENKEFEFEYNNKLRKIKINRVATVGEGISTYYNLDDNEREKDCLIIDIGGRTTNVCTFINKKLDKKFTITEGMINLYDQIKEKENNKGNNYKIEEIERLVKKELIKEIEDENIKFIKSILNQIELKVKKETFDIFLSGGGSIELKEELKNVLPNATIVENALFANVNGNKKIAKIQWSE